jgi:peptide/nickel transport system permease protein
VRGSRVHDGARPAALAVLTALVLFIVVWPFVSPHGAAEIDFGRARQAPSFAHPLGTDVFGRDLLTRLAEGGRNSLAIAGMALAAIGLLGILYGTTAAMAGRTVGEAMMRLLDGLFAVPRLPVAIAQSASPPARIARGTRADPPRGSRRPAAREGRV